jgi:RNA polymerase sigma-70 factor (sigma-E family)
MVQRMKDDRTFEEFVAARGSALLRTATLLCAASRHDAEDVVQSALEKAYRHWSRIDGDPEPYVRRILVNLTISRARRRKILREVHVAEPPETEVPGDADGVVLRDALIRELHRLPPRQRAVLVLRYWEDLSEAQTAQLLGCSVGTVKSQASKALARLRSQATPVGVS